MADGKKQKREMADWVITMAVPSNGYPLRRYNVAKRDRQEFESIFEGLLLKGCDRKAPITALWMANTLWVEPLPNTKKVKMAAKKMRVLAQEILELEKTGFHISAATERGCAEWAGTGRCGRPFAYVPALRTPEVAAEGSRDVR